VLHVSQNGWSVTTGRHLTWIDGGSPEAKKRRLSGEDFVKLMKIIKFDEQLPDSLQLLKI